MCSSDLCLKQGDLMLGSLDCQCKSSKVAREVVEENFKLRHEMQELNVVIFGMKIKKKMQKVDMFPSQLTLVHFE